MSEINTADSARGRLLHAALGLFAHQGFTKTSTREIAESAFRYQREIDQGIRKIVGVNAYAEKKPLTIPILEMDPAGYERQVQRLERVRKTRDNGRVGQALDRLRIAMEGTENTMPHIMEAVHAYATLGEIIQVMKEAFGVYEEPTMI